MKWNYTKETLVDALHELDIEAGDTLLIHSDLVALGIPKEFIERRANICELLYDALRTVVGAEGTIIVPTFSYSFCKGSDFNVEETPGDVGSFGNYIRALPGATRNRDPLFSFAAIGPETHLVTDFSGNNSFSPESSPFKNFYDANIKILFIGVDLHYLTAIHFAEQLFFNPQRYDKLFSGNIITKNAREKISWIYPVRVNIPHTQLQLSKLHAECSDAGILKTSSFLPIYSGKLRPILDLYIARASKDPWRYLQGPPCDLAAEDLRRTGHENHAVELPNTDLETMARLLAPLPRHLVSDGYDAALEALATRFPLRIHTYPTGTHAFTWIAPERWICYNAVLKSMDGRRIFSTAENPLHVVSYSKPFSGTVSREELLAHLHTPRPVVAERFPDAIPFVFKYYERDWGLCCSAAQKAALTDAMYRVEIDSDFSLGAVKVGEMVIEGSTRESIVFCAHLCHPRQLNDGLSGVLAGLKLMERLKERKNLRYTYRMLIVPETIGSACWLSHNQDLIPHLRGGMFLEMLATDHPHVLMHSNMPESWFDRLASLVLLKEDAANTEVPFLEAPLNDERMFNGTGIGCPMCSLMRITGRDDRLWPYAEYHTSLDTCEHANFANLNATVGLLERLVDAAEADLVPRPLWQGELFVSRFNSFDYARDGQLLRKITYSIDGRRTISEIGRICQADFFEVKHILDLLQEEKLLTYDEVLCHG